MFTPQRPAHRLLVLLVLASVVVGIGAGCSTATRYRIKTIIFTGVPPLQEQPAQDGAGQTPAPRSAAAEQLALQRRHREALVSRYWQHGPFAAGECARCHSLSQSASFLGNRNPVNQARSHAGAISASSRLVMPMKQLCVSCHTQHGPDFARERGLKRHFPAAKRRCTDCHNPHQSLRQYMLLKTDNRELCGSCHAPTALTSAHAENPEQDCIDCHNAHVGVTRKLLRSDARELTLLYGNPGHE